MFYPGTKKRISVSKGGKKAPLPTAKTPFDKFKQDIIKLCDKALKAELTPEKKAQVARLRARVVIL